MLAFEDKWTLLPVHISLVGVYNKKVPNYELLSMILPAFGKGPIKYM